ncbi:MAG: FAD-dependent oxidoreductase [Bacillales bacterium]|jgi:thioredoxin reductase (NADPH)|nr:FAD-dependent oxidoreductase [Bacillales bacterium]
MVIRELIIIGAGPAGMTAALYAERAGLDVLIIEKLYEGGKLINISSIENYPGFENINGVDLALNFKKNIKNVPIVYEEVLSLEKAEDIFIIQTNENVYYAKFVIVASGSSERPLKLSEAERYLNKGLSYCAVCDGSLYKGKVGAVMGGSASAIKETLYLSKILKRVYLIHRREEFRVNNIELKKVIEKENVTILKPYDVIKLLGHDKLESIIIKSNKEEKELEINCLFAYLGNDANSSFLPNEIKQGYVKVDKNNETIIKNLFVIGDLVEKEHRQISIAIGEASLAVLTIVNR